MSKEPENEKKPEIEEIENKAVEPKKEEPKEELSKENTEKEKATEKDSPSSNAEKKEEKKDDKKDAKKEEVKEEKPLTKQELKQIKKERSTQYKLDKINAKGRRALCCRNGKNFLIWLMGFLFAFVFLFGGAFIALKIVPLDTYIGEDNGIVDEEISNQSILDAIINFGSYNVGQLPIITDLLNDALVSGGLNEYVEVDMDKLENVQFSYPEGSNKKIEDELLKCIKPSSKLTTALPGVSLFEYDLVKEEVDATSANFVPKLYYYKEAELTKNVKYVRAFNDDGTPTTDLTGKPLYYANLADLYLDEIIEIIEPRLNVMPLAPLVDTIGGVIKDLVGEEIDLTIVKNILGDHTFATIQTFDINTIKLTNILPTKNELNEPINTEIYAVLSGLFVDKDGNKIDGEDLVVGDILEETGAKLKYDGITLSSVLNIAGVKDADSILEVLCKCVVRQDESKVTVNNLCIGDLMGTTATINYNGLVLGDILTLAKVDASILTTLSSFIIKNDGSIADATNITIGDLTGETATFGVPNDMVLKNLLTTLKVADMSFLNTLSSFIVRNDGSTVSADNLTIGDLTGVTATFGVPNTTVLKTLLTTLGITDTSFLTTLSSFIIRTDGTAVSADNLTIGDLTGVTATFGVPNTTVLKTLLANLGITDTSFLTTLSKFIVKNDGTTVTINNLTIGDLTGATGKFGVDGMSVSTLFNTLNITDTSLIDMLCKLVTRLDGSTVTSSNLMVSDLTGVTGNINLDGVVISTFFSGMDADLLDLICQAVVRADGSTVTPSNLTIGDLKGVGASFDLDSILISQAFTTIDEDFLELLCQALVRADKTEVTASNLTLGDLTGKTATFSLDGIYLNKLGLGEDLLKMLCKAVVRTDGTTATQTNLTIGDITGKTGTFSLDKIPLESLLGSSNSSLLKALSSAVVRTNNTEVTASNITLGDITGETGSFNINAIKLAQLNIDEDILNILSKAVVRTVGETVTSSNLTLGDLTGENGATFKIENIPLTAVLDENTNKSLYEILTSIVLIDVNGDGYINSSDKATSQHITIGSLKNVDFNGIKLSSVLPTQDANKQPINTKLYTILCSAIVYADGSHPIAEDITLGDLGSQYFNFNNVSLCSVLDESANAKLFEILTSIVQIDVNGDEIIDANDKVTNAHITIGSLSNIKMGGIRLATVLDNDVAHVEIYSLLEDLTGKDAADIIVDDLGHINTDNIHLNLVLPSYKHVELYKILCDFTGIADPSAILLGDFLGKDPNNMHLKTVLGDSVSVELKNFLCDLTHVKNFADITLNDLKDKDPNEMHLAVLIPDGEHKAELVNVLKEAVSEDDFNNVTLGSLANFNLQNVHLHTLLPEGSSNAILTLLVEDNTVTIGNIGAKIDGLKISQIFQAEAFTTVENGTAYYLENGNYYRGTKEGYTSYYISKNAKFWLFMLYTAVDGEDEDEFITDENGYADCYINKNLTFSGLNSGLDDVATALTSATIRQLVDAGIFADKPTFTLIYNKSLTDILG